VPPKKLRRSWKWATPDKAGTASIDPTDVGKSIIAFAASLTGGDLRASGSAEEYARATGRVIAYRDKTGRLFNKEGQPVEKTDRTMVVNLPEEH
jgi:hypothetical protein